MKKSSQITQAIALTLTAAALSPGLSIAAPCQERLPASADLAKRTFKALDANADGKVSMAEAGRADAIAKTFNAEDVNADKHLSEEEFMVLYHGLLADKGYPIGADLERAVKDIQSARKKAAEEKRTQEARQKQAKGSAEARTTAARKQQADLDAKRIQDARQKQAQESAEARTAAARKKQADLDAQRAQEARQKQTGDQKAKGAPKPTPVPVEPKKVKKPRKPADGVAPPPTDAGKGTAEGAQG
ncbi:MAG: hypothetical protein P8M11_06170 [Planctomycetota bacterium]|nr:hypothetical protein [Planctomycetota bacterium]